MYPTISIVLGIILLLAIWEISKVAIDVAIGLLHKVKLIWQNQKKFNQLNKKVKDMKNRGENHDWVELSTHWGDTLVCRKTGWCPKAEGFIDPEYVSKLIKEKELTEQIHEEFEEYYNKKMSELSTTYKLDKSEIEDLTLNVSSIKKDFYVKKMEESLKKAANEEQEKEQNATSTN